MSSYERPRRVTRWKLHPSLLLGLIFPMLAVLISVLDLTIIPVDQYHKYRFLPWVVEAPEVVQHRQWNLVRYRDADAIFQNRYVLLDHLQVKQESGERDFSFRTLLGFPLHTEYAASRGIVHPLTYWIKQVTPNDIRSVYLGANIGAGLWAALIFWVLWFFSNLLFGRPLFNTLLGVAANPVLFFSVQETYTMGLAGSLLIALGVVSVVRRTETNGAVLLACGLAFLGSLLVIRSGVFQYYLYLPVLYLFFTPYLVRHVSVRTFLALSAAIMLGFVIEVNYLLEVVERLNSSNKAIGEATSIADRRYSPFPIEDFIPLPLLNILSEKTANPQSTLYVGSDLISQAYAFLRSGYASPEGPFFFMGLAIGALGLIGFMQLNDRFLQGALLLIMLYYMGVLHYLLSVLVGGPFATESSMRMVDYVYMAFPFLAVHAIINKLSARQRRVLLFLAGGVLLITVVQIFLLYFYFARHKIWMLGVVQLFIVGALGVYLLGEQKQARSYWKMVRIGVLALMLTGATLSKTSLTANHTWLAYPISLGMPKLEIPNTNEQSVGALIIERTGKEWIHPNFWYDYQVKSIHAYKNPYHRGYTYLYWYQYVSNGEGTTQQQNIGIDHVSEIRDVEQALREQIRIDFLRPIQIGTQPSYSSYTDRFFDLTGVDLIATPSSIALTGPDLALVLDSLGTRIWKRERSVAPFRVVAETQSIADRDEAFHVLFSDAFDLNQSALTTTPIALAPKESRVTQVEQREGMLYVHVTGSGGLLCTNIPYYKDLHVEEVHTGRAIPTLVSNTAFLAFKVPGEARDHVFQIYYRTPSLLDRLRKW